MWGACRSRRLVLGLSSALFACSGLSQLRMVQQVESQIAEGADLDQPFRGRTALMVAARAGHLRVVEILIAAGADVNAQTSRTLEATALMMAARYGRTEIMEVLLDHGANVNRRTNNGYTALMRAARNGQTTAVRLLVQNGADVSIRNRGGVTALYHARSSNSLDIIEILLQAGEGSAEIASYSVESYNPFTRLRQTQRGRWLGDRLGVGLALASLVLTALSIALVVKRSSSLWLALALYVGATIVGTSYLVATAHHGPIRIDLLLLIPLVMLTYSLGSVVVWRGVASRNAGKPHG